VLTCRTALQRTKAHAPATSSLQVQLKDAGAAEQWKAAASKRFVFSAYFDGPSKLGLKVAVDSNGSA
jgi:hypothetical protein